MPRRMSSARLWAGALGVSATVAAVWWWWETAPPPAAQTASDSAPFANVVAAAPVTEVSETARDAGSSDPAVSLQDLWHRCPNAWSGISDECARALDARYLREPAGLAPLHKDPWGWDRSLRTAFDGVTWEEVFTAPVSVREAAREALDRDECRVAEGETRPDLGRTCAADDIAKLAILQAGCVMPMVLHGGFNPWRPPGEEQTWFGPSDAELDERWAWWVDKLDDDPSLSVEEYWRRRAEIDDARFRFAWRLMRCEAVPESAFAWLDSLPTPTAEPTDQHQGAHLTAIAARLGSEWAQREIEQQERIARENRQRRFQALIEKLREED